MKLLNNLNVDGNITVYSSAAGITSAGAASFQSVSAGNISAVNIFDTNMNGGYAVISNTNKSLGEALTTTTQINYLSAVTSDVQVQINTKANTTSLSAYQLLSEKNQANGYAGLDASKKIYTSALPDSILGQLHYIGTWNATTNTPALPNPNIVSGGYYIVSVSGTSAISNLSPNSINGDWKIGDWIVSNGTTWDKVDNTDSISSWNGRSGAILPIAGDYSTFYVSLTGSYSNPSWITALDPAKITQTSNYRFVTDTEKTTWNGKQAGSSVLTSIAALTTGSGFLKLNAGVASLDTNAYLTSAGTINNVLVTQNNTSNTLYPLVWDNGSNQLFHTAEKFKINPNTGWAYFPAVAVTSSFRADSNTAKNDTVGAGAYYGVSDNTTYAHFWQMLANGNLALFSTTNNGTSYIKPLTVDPSTGDIYTKRWVYSKAGGNTVPSFIGDWNSPYTWGICGGNGTLNDNTIAFRTLDANYTPNGYANIAAGKGAFNGAAMPAWGTDLNPIMLGGEAFLYSYRVAAGTQPTWGSNFYYDGTNIKTIATYTNSNYPRALLIDTTGTLSYNASNVSPTAGATITDLNSKFSVDRFGNGTFAGNLQVAGPFLTGIQYYNGVVGAAIDNNGAQWYAICTLNINYQYDAASIRFEISNCYNSGGSGNYYNFTGTLKIKQQSAMTSTLDMCVLTIDHMVGNYDLSKLKAVLTTDNSGLKAVTFYMNCPFGSDSDTFEIRQIAGNRAITRVMSFVGASLPAGTQYSAICEVAITKLTTTNIIFPSLNNYGNITGNGYIALNGWGTGKTTQAYIQLARHSTQSNGIIFSQYNSQDAGNFFNVGQNERCVLYFGKATSTNAGSVFMDANCASQSLTIVAPSMTWTGSVTASNNLTVNGTGTLTYLSVTSTAQTPSITAGNLYAGPSKNTVNSWSTLANISHKDIVQNNSDIAGILMDSYGNIWLRSTRIEIGTAAASPELAITPNTVTVNGVMNLTNALVGLKITTFSTPVTANSGLYNGTCVNVYNTTATFSRPSSQVTIFLACNSNIRFATDTAYVKGVTFSPNTVIPLLGSAVMTFWPAAGGWIIG